MGWNAGPTAPDDLSQAAPRAIALHRPTHTALAGDEPDATHLAGHREYQEQADAAAVGHPIAANAREIASSGQAVRRQEPLGRQVAHRGGGYGGWQRHVGCAIESERTTPRAFRDTRPPRRGDHGDTSGSGGRSGTVQLSDDTVRRFRP